jgi:hypothetical protein
MLSILTPDEYFVVVSLYLKVLGRPAIETLVAMEPRVHWLVLHAYATMVVVGEWLPWVREYVNIAHSPYPERSAARKF